MNWVITGPGNGLSPIRRQAITWTNAGLLLIGLLGTYFNEIWIGILTFSFKKMPLKMLSAKMTTILSRGRWVNSLRPGNSISHPRTWSTLAQIMAYCLFDAKPLLILNADLLSIGHQGVNLGEISIKIWNFCSRKKKHLKMIPLTLQLFCYFLEAEWRIYASVIWPSLVQIMACSLDFAKPLSEPVLEYC